MRGTRIIEPVVLPEVTALFSPVFNVHSEDAIHFQGYLLTGKVTEDTGIPGTSTTTVRLGIMDHADDFATIKTVAVAPSTDITFTTNVAVSGTNLASVAHGLVDNEAVAVYDSVLLPAGLSATTIYYVRVIDPDNLELKEVPDVSAPSVVFTADGVNPILTRVRSTPITLMQEVAADQPYIPMQERAAVWIYIDPDSLGAITHFAQLLGVII